MSDIRSKFGISQIPGGEITVPKTRPEKVGRGGVKKGDEVVFVTLEGTYVPAIVTKVHSHDCIDAMPNKKDGIIYSEADGLMFSDLPSPRRRSWHLKGETNAE